jgi:hypothetical protein
MMLAQTEVMASIRESDCVRRGVEVREVHWGNKVSVYPVELTSRQ